MKGKICKEEGGQMGVEGGIKRVEGGRNQSALDTCVELPESKLNLKIIAITITHFLKM